MFFYIEFYLLCNNVSTILGPFEKISRNTHIDVYKSFFSEGTVASKSEHKHEQGYKGFIFLLYLSRIGKKNRKRAEEQTVLNCKRHLLYSLNNNNNLTQAVQNHKRKTCWFFPIFGFVYNISRKNAITL